MVDIIGQSLGKAGAFVARPALVAAFVICASQLGMAQSLGFMPGDAFFVVALDEQLVNSLPGEGGKIELPYMVELFDFGNLHAGFDRLRIEDAPPQLVQNLRRAYGDHRRYVCKIVRKDVMADGSRFETELNAPIAFVYNRDVNLSEQRIALKYNEDWPNLPADAFAGPDRGLRSDADRGIIRAECYLPLVKTYDAVVADWANARRFKPLAVRVPKDVAWGKWGKPIKEPIVVQGRDVQIVVTTGGDLEGYFLQKPDAQYYQVTTDGVNACRWQSGDGGVEVIKERLGEGGGASHWMGPSRKASCAATEDTHVLPGAAASRGTAHRGQGRD